MIPITDYLTHYLLLLLGFVSKKLSVKNRFQFGKLIGNCLRLLSKSRSDITFNNIKAAFPEKTTEWHKLIRNESYHNLGITLAELLAFPSFSERDFRNYIKIENTELVHRNLAKGNGMILLSGHFGNWEIMAYVAGLVLGVPITIIVKPQKNKLSNVYLNKFRTQGGNHIVNMRKAARTLIETIKKNEAVAMLVDQSANSKKDIFVDFFGRPASTYEAPAIIALKFRTPIVTGFAHRQPDFTYKVVLEELNFDDLDDSKESVLELTRRHVKVLENNIRMNPGHWAWQHKRWKHIPL